MATASMARANIDRAAKGSPYAINAIQLHEARSSTSKRAIVAKNRRPRKPASTEFCSGDKRHAKFIRWKRVRE